MKKINDLVKKLILLSACLGVIACVQAPGGEQDDLLGEEGEVGQNGLISGVPNTSGATFIRYEFAVIKNNPAAALQIINKPAWAVFDSNTGLLNGVPTAVGTFSNISIVATFNDEVTTIGPFDIEVGGDRLRQFAWHLDNTGQTNFSVNPGEIEEDVDATAATALGYTGLNIDVAVTDSGVEIQHADLIANIGSGHKNYKLPSPHIGSPDHDGAGHGTAVAGIIAATAGNSEGSRGVAPGARIIGYNFLNDNVNVTNSVLIDQAMGNNIEVFNQSWGLSNPMFDNPLPAYIANMDSAVSNGREGKGQIYVKSAGNDYSIVTNRPSPLDPYGNHQGMIIVSAVNAEGVKASYSSTGSNIWVAAPGGEFGVINPAITTTDLIGCTQGFAGQDHWDLVNGGNPLNNFEDDSAGLNPNCNYTSVMNGTSSSAPIVSGIVALMLEANPDLTYRDIKHILAVTAEKVDPTFSDREISGLPNNYIAEYGWKTNGAGNDFCNYYGFGRANAEAAVTLAQSYTAGAFGNLVTSNYTENASGTINLAVPDFDENGATDAINVNANINFIEAIQLRVQANHPDAGDLGFDLASPSGMVVKVMDCKNTAVGTADIPSSTFLVNGFYGESSNGSWTLTAYDCVTGDTGVINQWQMKIFGHN